MEAVETSEIMASLYEDSHANFYNEAHTLGFDRLPNKNEHMRTKTETDERNVVQPVRLTLCFGVHLL
jgi:hypothetical protein